MSWPIVWFMKMTTGPLHEGHNLKKGAQTKRITLLASIAGAIVFAHPFLHPFISRLGKYMYP